MTLSLSVVVPTYNKRDYLPRLLEALASQDAEPGSFEVVVVDNASTDGTEAWLRTQPHPWLRVLTEPVPGAANARNAGWRAARGPQILFLDDDMVPDPDVVRLHQEAFGRDPGASYLGFVEYRWETLTHPLSRYVMERTVPLLFPAHAGDEASYFQYITQHVSSPRAAVERVGGFAPAFRGYGYEDPELGYKLHRAGVPTRYLPEAKALNTDPHRPEGHWRKTRLSGEAQALFLRLHPEVVSLDRRRYLSGRLGFLWSAYRSLLGERLDALAAKADPTRLLPAWVRLHYRLSTAALLHRGFRDGMRTGRTDRGDAAPSAQGAGAS